MTKELPTEVLLRIFEEVDEINAYEYNGGQGRARDFHQCQLVCKSWRNAAQSSLYKKIPLNASAAKLVRTIQSQPYIAAFVKELDVDYGFDALHDSYSFMDTILTCCWNIQIIDSGICMPDATLYSCLLQDHVQLKHLRDIRPGDGELAAFVMLKFCKTLDCIRIHLNDSNPDPSVHARGKYLLRRIRKFVALKQLRLSDDAITSDVLLDRLLDDCPASMTYLEMEVYDMTWSKPLTTILPQAYLQVLEITEYANLDHRSVEYLMRKFPALKRLEVSEAFEYPTSNEQEWWTHFMALCERLDELSFSTNFSAHHLRHQIDKIVALALKLQKEKEHRYIRIDFNPQSARINQESGTKDHISFGKTNGSSGIFISSCQKPNIISWLKDYAPGRADVQGVVDMNSHYNMDFSGKDIKSYYKAISNQKSLLAVLTKTLNAFGQNEKQTVGFSNIILCGISLALFSPKLVMSELMFGHSIIADDFWPELSTKLHPLDTLTLFSCCYIMEEPYNLKISLPSTRLNQLRLHFASCTDATSSAKRRRRRLPFHRDLEIDKSWLESNQLLAAVCPTGRYTLKIETDLKTHVLLREGDETVGRQPSASRVHGTKNNFLIWIKCVDLKAFHISPKKSSPSKDAFEYL